jgi:LemA protein
VENQLQYARRFYNGAVRDYNDAVQRVPDLAVARAFAFTTGEFYQAEAEQRTAVAVKMP